MPETAPNRTRSRLPRILAAVAALAAVMGALELAGAFDGEEEPVDPAPLAAPPAPQPKPPPPPDVETIKVGGRPGAIAAGEGGVVVADPFTAAAAVIQPAGVVPGARLRPRTFPLAHPATSVGATGGDAWFGFPQQHAVERVSAEDPVADRAVLDLDATPTAIEADADGAWILTENSVYRLEGSEGDVAEKIGAGGFATAFDVAGGQIWVIADNREVRRFDAETLEAADRVAEVPDATAISVGEGYVWVLSSTGELTRLDPESLRRVGEPVRISGALALAVGEGSVWVTAADNAVTRVDPASGEVVGRPVRVGDEPVAIAAGDSAIWVANAGDGTVTWIAP